MSESSLYGVTSAIASCAVRKYLENEVFHLDEINYLSTFAMAPVFVADFIRQLPSNYASSGCYPYS